MFVRQFILRNRAIGVLLLCVIASGAALLHVGQDVYSQRKKVGALKREIAITEKEIASLGAEIAFLSSPQRLDQIASAFTGAVSPASMMPTIMSDNQFARKAAYIPVKPKSKPSRKVFTQVKSKRDFSDILNHVGGER